MKGIEKLPTNKQKAEAYRMICEYALDGTEPSLDGKNPLMTILFGVAQPVPDTAKKRVELAKPFSQRTQTVEDAVQQWCAQE